MINYIIIFVYCLYLIKFIRFPFTVARKNMRMVYFIIEYSVNNSLRICLIFSALPRKMSEDAHEHEGVTLICTHQSPSTI